MAEVSKKGIIEMMERLQDGESLVFQLPQTFGGDKALLELNPRYPEKGEKKYVLLVGKTEEKARDGKPYWTSDKAKKLAAWVADRVPTFIEHRRSLQKAI